MNERLTESFTRDLISQTYNQEEVYVNEQISSNQTIKKLLGNKKPDFIIDFKDNSKNIIVIIECKADAKNQKQALQDAENKYASLLKASYNVLYYGISGQNLKRSCIEGRLWFKEHKQPFPNSITKLLKYQDISKWLYKLTDDKKNHISKTGLNINKVFNEKLEKISIPAHERPIIIGCFLIALLGDVKFDDNNFSYRNNIITAVKNKLQKQKMDSNKIDIIIRSYEGLLSNSVWIDNEVVDSYGGKSKNTNLNYFIEKLKKEIMPFVHDIKWDIMGNFYREFIKYATEDKKTGLVLTPPHITEFFCELANIQISDIVLDPCCGTGGFLISAMKYMLKKATNEKQEQKIKSKQLFGVEKRSDMWLHASVNMMMHGDGHTNIVQKDCFACNTDDFKDKQPTVAFLNPPYNGAGEQLRFIQKALELVVPKGKVIAIIQASAVRSSKDVNYEKEQMLKKHTLLASFSCPKELFHGIAGVITNILIFEAHVPHNPKNATFLGWFKDDGFIKQKKKRIEQNWKEIKNKWIYTYDRKKEIKEVNMESKMQILTASDEWCIEAYLKPDLPSQKDFMLTIKEYILHELEDVLDNEIKGNF